MKFVIVDWTDSNMTFSGWETIEHACGLEPSECQTGGWIVLENDNKIILAMSHSEQTVGGLFTIEKKCISNIQIIKDTPDIELPDNPKQKIDWH